MQNFKLLLAPVLLGCYSSAYCQQMPVGHFDKVIISPRIQVTFIQGEREGVTFDSTAPHARDVRVELHGNTLRIYLKGAKELEKTCITYEHGFREKRPVYQGTLIRAVVTYRTLHTLSVRGDETQTIKSMVTARHFLLRVMGAAHILFDRVDLGSLHAVLYGSSTLDILSGSIGEERFTAYGESRINALSVNSATGRITAYGEADFSMNVSQEITISSFGTARLRYRGAAQINKGINIDGPRIMKLD